MLDTRVLTDVDTLELEVLELSKVDVEVLMLLRKYIKNSQNLFSMFAVWEY